MTITTVRRKATRVGALIVLMSLTLGLAACGSSESSAPTLDDPAVTARGLIINWLDALKDKDLDAVADAMAPSFQIQRADGSSADRAEYLAKPATVESYTLSDEIVATQSGNTLTARWSIRITEVLNGISYNDVTAPRLTVFEWQDGAWLIVGYANFNPSVAGEAS
jgi:ketosteroid isomerase-like protein